MKKITLNLRKRSLELEGVGNVTTGWQYGLSGTLRVVPGKDSEILTIALDPDYNGSRIEKDTIRGLRDGAKLLFRGQKPHIDVFISNERVVPCGSVRITYDSRHYSAEIR